jgi:DNA-binding MarR family transcriptional regulator
MIDRLEKRGLARRVREAADRRVITAKITSEGTRLLDKLDDSVAMLHARQIGPLGERGMREIQKLLQALAEVGPVI